QVIGAMNVTFDGREQTLPQMGRYQESQDRSVREAAWRAVAERRYQDHETIDGIYDEMIARRDLMAKNAGFENFVGYAFKSKKRFDYTPKETRTFQEAVERAVVPFKRKLDAKRKA